MAMKTKRHVEATKGRLPDQTTDDDLASAGLFVQEDWVHFSTLPGISMWSGVPAERLRRLVVKELADNSLDVCGRCDVGELVGGGFYVEDPGPGLPGGPEQVARLFSVNRPLASSKIIRMPTRGALGNGLRVVTGAVWASGGTLEVCTHGRRLRLTPQESGETSWQDVRAWRRAAGTRVEVWLGDSIPADSGSLVWANLSHSCCRDFSHL